MSVLTDDELRYLRIFPLPGVTLFPHGVLPLHVFEPRYRKLVQDCLAGGMPFAPWAVDEKADAAPRGPRLLGVATAGRIRSHQRLEDGRFDILVEGVERIRLVAERDTDQPYRVVEAERFPLEPCAQGGTAEHVATLRSLASTLALEHPRAGRLLQVTIERCEEPGELSDVLCGLVHDSPKLRQRLLETSSVPERLERVVETLSTLLLRAPGARRSDEETH